MKPVSTLLILTCASLAAITVDPGMTLATQPDGPYPVLDAPMFTASLARGQLRLSGTTLSAEHESGLQRVAADQFATRQITTQFVPGILLAESWTAASVQLLHTLAKLESATAVMHEDKIILRGITSDTAAVMDRLRSLREVMPEQATIEENIIVVDSSASLDALCRDTFQALLKEPISFHQSSAEVRTSSYSSLDKFVDYAYDCYDTKILIVGHTDASGNEEWNLRLSRARAQAVADYLVRGGVVADRLTVAGRGAATPVASNATAYGRSLNRRIEFILQQSY